MTITLPKRTSQSFHTHTHTHILALQSSVMRLSIFRMSYLLAGIGTSDLLPHKKKSCTCDSHEFQHLNSIILWSDCQTYINKKKVNPETELHPCVSGFVLHLHFPKARVHNIYYLIIAHAVGLNRACWTCSQDSHF